MSLLPFGFDKFVSSPKRQVRRPNTPHKLGFDRLEDRCLLAELRDKVARAPSRRR